MNRSDPFETVRGDEWWYTDVAVEMTLESQPSAGPPAMSICTIKAKSGRLSASQLHRLLWLTQQRFPDLQVRCLLDGDLPALFSVLAERGVVNWEAIEHSFSKEAKLLGIKSPDEKAI